MSWLDLLPDFMVMILPAVAAVILLITDFTWPVLGLLVLLLLLSFGANAVTRGSFACKYCKQRELGCPAERLFNKESRATPYACNTSTTTQQESSRQQPI